MVGMMPETIHRCLAAFASLALAVCVMVGGMTTWAALAQPVPSGLVGAWSEDCSNPAAAQIILQPNAAAIVAAGQQHIYAGLEISHSWLGGAKAEGDRIWILTSRKTGQPYEFILAQEADALVMEEGHPDFGQEVRTLFGTRFVRCGTGGKQARTNSGVMAGAESSAGANILDVPIMELAGDGQAANCMSSVVSGLKADGDGFLAVRSGPDARYRKIAELYNGDVVVVFEYRGKWAGVVYGTAEVRCSSNTTVPVTYERKGWVHTAWLKDLAG